jgi:hypothetical protein
MILRITPSYSRTFWSRSIFYEKAVLGVTGTQALTVTAAKAVPKVVTGAAAINILPPFSEVNTGLTGVEYSSVAWGDYDNDGRLDILLTVYTGSTGIARVYHNNGNSTFTDSGAGLTEVYNGSVAWGDYDNDGWLDILLTGYGYTGSTTIAKVYHNNTPATNSVPVAPARLRAAATGTTVNLVWDAASDSQTPAVGLTYNLRVGTMPGGTQIAAPMADTGTGFRRVPQIVNSAAITSTNAARKQRLSI